MPRIFKIGGYLVYFWSNENSPLEPVHVHITEGKAGPNATKVWITSTGKTLLCHNNSEIPDRILKRLPSSRNPSVSYCSLLIKNVPLSS